MLLFFTVNALRSFKTLLTLHLQPTTVHHPAHRALTELATDSTRSLTVSLANLSPARENHSTIPVASQ